MERCSICTDGLDNHHKDRVMTSRTGGAIGTSSLGNGGSNIYTLPDQLGANGIQNGRFCETVDRNDRERTNSPPK